jgi:thiamine-phosphate pyrophosphorylase
MKDPASWDLYLVTDRGLSRERSLLEVVEASVLGGVSAVQLREKDLSTRLFFEEGLKIRGFLESRGVPLIINDRIDLALALDADGVHVGQDDMPVEIARKLIGPDKILGLSLNEPEQIDRAALEYADYLAVSPVFHTATKEDITSPWGLEGVSEARLRTELPLVGIGSMNRENARAVIKAGADCIAVISAIVSADDPQRAAARLLEEVRAGKRERLV